ncbi:retrotransposon protein, putative, ty3-gypsy subclass [Tanacetum coccineum]
MSADSAVTYTSVHSEARSWSIPSEDPYEEAARQLLEQAPHSNVPLDLRRDQVDDLMPTIEEGKVVEEFRVRNDARMGKEERRDSLINSSLLEDNECSSLALDRVIALRGVASNLLSSLSVTVGHKLSSGRFGHGESRVLGSDLFSSFFYRRHFELKNGPSILRHDHVVLVRWFSHSNGSVTAVEWSMSSAQAAFSSSKGGGYGFAEKEHEQKEHSRCHSLLRNDKSQIITFSLQALSPLYGETLYRCMNSMRPSGSRGLPCSHSSRAGCDGSTAYGAVASVVIIHQSLFILALSDINSRNPYFCCSKNPGRAYKRPKEEMLVVLTLTWGSFQRAVLYFSFSLELNKSVEEEACWSAEDQDEELRGGLHKSYHRPCHVYTVYGCLLRNSGALGRRPKGTEASKATESTNSGSQRFREPVRVILTAVCNTCGRRQPGECRCAAVRTGHADKKPDTSGRGLCTYSRIRPPIRQAHDGTQHDEPISKAPLSHGTIELKEIEGSVVTRVVEEVLFAQVYRHGVCTGSVCQEEGGSHEYYVSTTVNFEQDHHSSFVIPFYVSVIYLIRLQGANIFSRLIYGSGYHQLRCERAGHFQTAFSHTLMVIMNYWLCLLVSRIALQPSKEEYTGGIFGGLIVSAEELLWFPAKGYYRIFVEGFSRLALPLTKLMRKGEKFVWNEEREKSFEELKQRLVSSPILTLPSGTGGFQIYSDASKKGLGCVLMQRGKWLLLLRRKSGKIAGIMVGRRDYSWTFERLDIELCVRGNPSFAVDVGWHFMEGLLNYGTGDLHFREALMTEAHSSPFSIHRVSTKMLRLTPTSKWAIATLEISVWRVGKKYSMDFGTGYNGLRGSHDVSGCFVDRLTKSDHFLPIRKDYPVSKIAEMFQQEIIRLHGTPSAIVSDRDPRFTSRFWQGLQKAWGTRLKFSTAFHPEERQDSRGVRFQN